MTKFGPLTIQGPQVLLATLPSTLTSSGAQPTEPAEALAYSQLPGRLIQVTDNAHGHCSCVYS